jgi:hypothetical protein
MGGCCAEERIIDIRDARMEERSGKKGRMQGTFEGGQGPERAVVPWIDGRIFTPTNAHMYSVINFCCSNFSYIF